MAKSLNEIARQSLRSLIDSLDETADDVLRAVERQATLLSAEERVKDALTADPFERLETIPAAITELKSILKVTDFHSVATLEGYCLTLAEAAFPLNSNESSVYLSFRYERRVANDNKGPTVSYTIDLSRGSALRRKLLWVQVWAVANAPSGNARNVADDEDDLWSDIESGDDEYQLINPSNNGKRARTIEDCGELREQSGEKAVLDLFAAGADPDLIEELVNALQLAPMDDLTAVFLLMTFPFFDHEWDLVGFLLDAVFGGGDEDENGMQTDDCRPPSPRQRRRN